MQYVCVEYIIIVINFVWGFCLLQYILVLCCCLTCSLALHLLAVAGKPVIPPSPVELSDMVCCSRHMEENLSLLASAMDVTDDEMEQLSMKYKSTQGQALQLLKIWQRNIGGSKQDLYKLLTSAGFSSAAKR